MEIKVYHGSQSPNIKSFRSESSYGKPGIFFSDSRGLAEAISHHESDCVYECTLRPRNPMRIDAGGRPYNNLRIETDGKSITHISELLEAYGGKCDCLEVDNIEEYDGTYAVTDYIVFDPSIVSIDGNEGAEESARDEKLFVRLSESLLLERKRQEILNRSRTGDQYKSRPGENRYTRRTKSSIAATVADYNKIDMNAFFKGDMLEFGIRVKGETDNYVVTILFEHILDELKKQIRQNKGKLEFRCILQALSRVFNSDDIYVSCTCPDFLYGGYNYYSFKGSFNSNPILGRGIDKPVIRNPNNTKGDACKHILLCLSNLDWLMKIASVIHNYINYCKDHMEYNYTRYIAPKLFDSTQMMLFDPDRPSDTGKEADLGTDSATIGSSNAHGRVRGRFQPGSNKNPVTNTGGRPFRKSDTMSNDQLRLNFGREKRLDAGKGS